MSISGDRPPEVEDHEDGLDVLELMTGIVKSLGLAAETKNGGQIIEIREAPEEPEIEPRAAGTTRP